MTYVGNRLVELLEVYGVRYIFGVPGGQTLGLYKGVLDRSNGLQSVQHVLLRDERSCVFAADAFARLSHTTGVCDATVCPGATNLVSGLAEAYASSIPLVAIVSDVDRSWGHLRQRAVASQALESTQMMFAPVTKWFGRLETPDGVSDFVDTAFGMANSGRPGPVVLEIPEDVFLAPLEASIPHRARPRTWPWFACAPDPDQVSTAAQVLTNARRPAIIAGAGVLASRAQDVLVEMAEVLTAPVATTMSGKGAVSEQHQCAVGVIGSMGVPIANEIVRRADVVLLIGSKAGQGSMVRWGLLSPDATVVYIDIDPANFGLSGRVVPLWADARLAMTELLLTVTRGAGHSEWNLSEVAADRNAWRKGTLETASEQGDLRPPAIVDLLDRSVGSNVILVCDASLSSGWGATYFAVDGADRRYLAPRGLAGLGWGAPAAIGAALADNSKRVVCLAGDGAWAYSMGEVESMVRLGLPILSVVLNNQVLAWSKHGQTKRLGGQHLSTDFSPVDFATAATGLGAQGRTIKTLSQLERAVHEWRGNSRTTVLDIATDQDETPVLPSASFQISDA